MRQVLFNIPGTGIPVFGYGLMLCLALFACGYAAARAARRQGKSGDAMWDLLVWVVIPGIVTARLFFFIQYFDRFDHWYEFFFLWQGGLVVYGSVLGAVAGLIAFAWRRNFRILWLLDLVAPVIGLGLAFGRVGCLLNGCCYGDYCEQNLAVRFPASSPPHQRLVERQLQSPLGFVVDAYDRKVLLVEPESSAAQKNLKVGDQVVALNGERIGNPQDLSRFYQRVNDAIFMPSQSPPLWPLEVTYRRGDVDSTVYLDRPRSLPLHPTQLYSSANGLILFFLLASLYPLRKRDGEVVATFAILYSITRFCIEFLRFDEPSIFAGMTISQNLSVLMFVLGLAMLLYVRRQPVQYNNSDSFNQGAKPSLATSA